MPKVDRYADAPRLPGDGLVDPRCLVGAGRKPVELDVGSGRGWFVIGRLESDPTSRVVGLEIRRKWAAIVDRRLARRGLSSRGRVFAEDARYALGRFPDACLSLICAHFPDPWWKKRHRKRALVTEGFVRQAARLLVSGGELFIQTDVEDRAREYERLVAGEPSFERWGPSARVEVNPYGTLSPREKRVISDGLPVMRLRYRRA